MKKTFIALGSFDGLHSGHMAVLRQALTESELTPYVLTFEPSPATVVRSEPPKRLITDKERAALLRELGFNEAALDFNAVRGMSARGFFEKILIGKMNAGALSCGFNYHFGNGGKGTTQTLRDLCEEKGIILRAAPPVMFEGSPVSSTRIRAALENGNISDANTMLGRPYSITAKVVHGDGIGGRVLGCPTANQMLPDELVKPRFGVYRSETLVDGKLLPSVTNIGTRPTLNRTLPLAETHIKDFTGDLYEKTITVRLLGFLRGEMKFETLDELKTQLQADINSEGGTT